MRPSTAWVWLRTQGSRLITTLLRCVGLEEGLRAQFNRLRPVSIDFRCRSAREVEEGGGVHVQVVECVVVEMVEVRGHARTDSGDYGTRADVVPGQQDVTGSPGTSSGEPEGQAVLERIPTAEPQASHDDIAATISATLVSGVGGLRELQDRLHYLVWHVGNPEVEEVAIEPDWLVQVIRQLEECMKLL